MATHPPSDAPFREAGARYMREQNARITKHLPGTLSGEDPEDLHDMRVATRRLRAAMLVFSTCFAPRDYRRWRRRVSRLTGALGDVRDLDVQMAAIERRRDGLPDDQQRDVDAWIAAHKDRREAARTSMIAVIESWRDKGRSEALEKVLCRMDAPDRLRALLGEVRNRLEPAKRERE